LGPQDPLQRLSFELRIPAGGLILILRRQVDADVGVLPSDILDFLKLADLIYPESSEAIDTLRLMVLLDATGLRSATI